MRTHVLPPLVGILAAVFALAPFALAQGPVVKMQPGTSYDPAACSSVTTSGGLYNCLAPATTINGVPLCDGQAGRPAHDPTRWHPLIERNGDGSVLCTYGHEHGMPPSNLDGVFGPMNVPGGQSISYPWATPNENCTPETCSGQFPNKHRVYKVMGGQNFACPAGEMAVTALRLEAHNDGNLGVVNRFHSYWFEAQTTDCSSGAHGYVSMGGHMDYARLNAGGQTVVQLTDPPAGCTVNGDQRGEGILGGVEQSTSVWYGTSNRPPGCDDAYGFGQHITSHLNVGTNSWGPVDPNSPSTLHFYANRDAHDGTLTNSDTFTLSFDGGPWTTDASGHINFTGFVDRHGSVVGSCSPLGPDCVPLVIRNVKQASYATRSNFGFDGDVPGPNGQRGFYVETPRT
jgi:hypothetical protein